MILLEIVEKLTDTNGRLTFEYEFETLEEAEDFLEDYEAIGADSVVEWKTYEQVDERELN